MKKIFSTALCAIMMVLCTTTVAAQPNDNPEKKQLKQERREKLADAQARHIANELALDDATSQKFISTFTDYQKEFWALKDETRPEKKHEMTEADAEKNIKMRMERKRKMLDLREKYYKKYSQFLTQKQIQRVYDIEERDMQRLSEGMKGHHGQHHHGKKGPGKHNF